MLFVIFSSFNPTDKKEEIFDKKTKFILTQWYELFLVLESKDINAYPPLSSQRIANLGVGGYITYKELDKHFLKHDHYALYVLNDIYCYQLQNYFNNFTSSELLKITHLRDRIRASFSEDHLQIDGNITLIENNIIDKVSLFFHNKNNCNNPIPKKSLQYYSYCRLFIKLFNYFFLSISLFNSSISTSRCVVSPNSQVLK